MPMRRRAQEGLREPVPFLAQLPLESPQARHIRNAWGFGALDCAAVSFRLADLWICRELGRCYRGSGRVELRETFVGKSEWSNIHAKD